MPVPLLLQRRSPFRLLSLATVLLLLPVSAAWAAEGSTGTISYARQFMFTDNIVGTTLIWFCFVMSIGIGALIIQNALINRVSVFIPSDFVATLQRLIDERNFREALDLTADHPSPIAQTVHAAIKQSPRGFAAMELAIEESIDAIASRRIRQLIWLEIAGAAGPMIGLFGTVYGMILAFNHLVAAGGTPKAPELAGGIATALVCTFWGLVVGIPGVISASIYRVMIEGAAFETMIRAKEMIAPFRPHVGKSATTPAAPVAVSNPA